MRTALGYVDMLTNNRNTKIAMAIAVLSTAIAHAGNSALESSVESFPFPSAQQSQVMYDELDYQRAVQVAIWGQPLVGLAAMTEGAKRIGIQPLQLFIFNDALQVNQHLLTGNSDIIYAFAYYDLSVGPIVVDLPGGEFFGSILDAWQRPIEDLGKVGPDNGSGGRYLILPPGYTGKLPEDGYIVRPSQTITGMVFLRALLTQGRTKAAGAVALQSVRVHALNDTKVIAPRLMSHSNYDGLPPRGDAFFDLLARTVGRETPNERDRVMLGLLAPLGIEAGKPFTPNQRLRALLARAADQARSILANMNYNPRSPAAKQSIFEGTHWLRGTGLSHYSQDIGPLTQVDERAQLFAYGFSVPKSLVPDMKPKVGKGAIYATTFRDTGGQFLSGEKYYRLHIPARVPVEEYWSVTAYDADRFDLIETDQKKASLSSLQNLKQNADGSTDIYFGPDADGKSNWIKTIANRGYFLILRLFGPTQPFYDHQWTLGDTEKIH